MVLSEIWLPAHMTQFGTALGHEVSPDPGLIAARKGEKKAGSASERPGDFSDEQSYDRDLLGRGPPTQHGPEQVRQIYHLCTLKNPTNTEDPIWKTVGSKPKMKDLLASVEG